MFLCLEKSQQPGFDHQSSIKSGVWLDEIGQYDPIKDPLSFLDIPECLSFQKPILIFQKESTVENGLK